MGSGDKNEKADGKKSQATLPRKNVGRYTCRILVNGRPCGHEMASNSHQIASHESDFHRDGAYKDAMATGPLPCHVNGCNSRPKNLKALVRHVGKCHQIKGPGTENRLRVLHGLAVKGRAGRGRKAAKTRRVSHKEPATKPDSDTESETESDGGLFVPGPADRRPGNDNGNNRPGRGGGGGAGLGGQILASNVIACT
ncbi:hypothetical protein GGS20DRAFT_559016 [Poronia punctata]|nr:hypothetical protein GGS20DRAFT_559016 [Poronia punctata]